MSEVATKTQMITGAEIFSFVTSGSRGWAKYYSDTGPIFLRMGNLDRGTISLDLSDIQHVCPPEGTEGTRTKVQEGDILISITADLGMVGLVPQSLGEAYINQHVALARPTEIIEPRYGAWFLASKHAQDQFEENRRGAVKAGLRLDDIRNLRVPLPPIPEQRRIVARIEELFSRLDAGVAALRHAKAQLQRYRQSVLAAAVTGQLTQEWREQHPDTESAKELLERILNQRRAVWTGKEKYKDPANIYNSDFPPLPKQWAWATTEQLCSVVASGSTPSPDQMTSADGEIPFLKVYNLTFGGKLDFSIKPTFISRSIHEARLKRSRVIPGDVLTNIVGPPLGKVSTVPDTHPEWNINQAIVVFRPTEAIFSKLMEYWLLSDPILRKLSNTAKATAGQFNIQVTTCRKLELPLPPLAEQHQIVVEVEARTTAIDHLEAELDRQITRSNRLRQSTLAAAFSGKLNTPNRS